MTPADDQAAAERAKLHETMAITAAESTVTSARMAELMEAQRAARARHAARQRPADQGHEGRQRGEDRSRPGVRGNRLPRGRPHRPGGY